MTSIRCRSNSGKERTGASWKLEMLLLAEGPLGLPEAESTWSPGAASGCDSGPTLSLQRWDYPSSAQRCCRCCAAWGWVLTQSSA